MTDDAHLLRQYCEVRSETAFAELVERHLGLVYHCALRQLDGDVHLARDTAQIVFVLLAERARALQGHPSLAGWLYATAHFKASEAMRSERRRKHREEAAASMRESLAESVAAPEPEQIREILDQAILELNDRDREAILLRFFEGHAYAEIAARVALTEKAAHKRVERALAQLRRNFVRRGVASGAEALGLILGSQVAQGAPPGLAAAVTGAVMASPGPATALSALKFMTATKMTASIAAVAGILLVGLGVRENAVLRRTTAALATSREESDALTEQFRQLEQKVHALRADRLAMESDPAYLGSGLSTAAESVESNAGMGAEEGAKSAVSRTALNADPQVHEALGKLVAWGNATFFDAALKAAGLSAAQIERAEYLIGQGTAFKGFGADPLSFKTGSQSWNEISNELQQTIGPEGTANIHSFLLNWQVVGGLAGSLYDTDSPLTSQQAAQLTQVLASTNQVSNPGGGWYVPQKTNWDAALAQAGQFLSPMQLANLRNLAIGRFGSTAP